MLAGKIDLTKPKTGFGWTEFGGEQLFLHARIEMRLFFSSRK
jgi:hypothetical protein